MLTKKNNLYKNYELLKHFITLQEQIIITHYII